MDRSQFAFVNVSTCCFNWLISFSFCAFNARNRSDSSFIWRMSLTRADFIPWKKKKNPPSIRNSDKCIAKWRLDSGYVRGYHCRVGCRLTRREPPNQAVLLAIRPCVAMASIQVRVSLICVACEVHNWWEEDHNSLLHFYANLESNEKGQISIGKRLYS